MEKLKIGDEVEVIEPFYWYEDDRHEIGERFVIKAQHVGYGFEHFVKKIGEGKRISIKPMPTITPLDKYRLIGETIGKLVDEKNKAYGDSFNKSAEFLKILYPNGVPVEHYSDMLGIIRVFDKLMRIANGNQGNENGWNDLAGYGILKSAD